jgi:hypothetical protein
MLCEWDRSNPEKPEISDKYHSDVCDAVLYAFRESLHWLHVPPAAPKERPTGDALARELEEAAEERFRQAREPDLFNSSDDAWI